MSLYVPKKKHLNETFLFQSKIIKINEEQKVICIIIDNELNFNSHRRIYAKVSQKN